LKRRRRRRQNRHLYFTMVHKIIPYEGEKVIIESNLEIKGVYNE
jgi:hypothetical protein